MKVMFIVPPEIFPIESYASDRIIKTREPRPRLGILCVAGYLRDKIGIAPIIVDCAAEGIDIKDIKCNDLKEISGIGWKNTTGKINLNAPCEVTHDLDDFGLPAHDLIDLSKYSHALSNEPYTAYIQTSRGCPFKCNFCDMRMTNFRSRSEEMVIREIRLL